jgi:hypothetical protein
MDVKIWAGDGCGNFSNRRICIARRGASGCRRRRKRFANGGTNRGRDARAGGLSGEGLTKIEPFGVNCIAARLGRRLSLDQTSHQTSIYEVIQAVDPIERIRDCPLGLDAHGHEPLALHKRLDDATALIEEQFRATTIAELIGTPKGKRNACFQRGTVRFPLLSTTAKASSSRKR